MVKAKVRRLTIDTRRYYLLAPQLPFVDACLQAATIRQEEFSRIEALAAGYQNDPRTIEMVRLAGDASAKVPYLMGPGETPASILEALRLIAAPHVARIEGLPTAVRSAIHLLLSTNTLPRGCEEVCIPALLELDRVQEMMVKELHDLMAGRPLAREFQEGNLAALQALDRDWPRLLEKQRDTWPRRLLPETPRMQFRPFFDRTGRMVSLRETCVIVDLPHAAMLQQFTPPVLRRPLPEGLPVPATGSADWLIREVGKIGRHFTRALLEIIKAHLAAEKVALEAGNYARITRAAQEALREHIEGQP